MTFAENSLMLELKNVSHSYRSSKANFDNGLHHVLNDVSLRLHQGETLGVIGRNGVGKTTMLQLMAGILAPTAGVVRRAAGKSASLLSLGLGFRPDLSGRNNAFLSAMLQGATKLEAKNCLEEIKNFSELGDSFEEPVKTYSAGMRARLGFTTALVTHVDIMLVDEVLSVGDKQFRKKAELAMKERLSGEQTVVFVSHSISQVETICSRAVWLDQGSICMDGTPAEVLKQYGNSN